MYLKSLILKGFKSFADRSVLSFEPGITAIVGPNGSGKSNISDSILWVLGERNAKNLRGQAMEDVIFAGSSARKPVGIAEVDLILDNSDETLAIDYSEVVITRRMYRSGESEYLINGALARRMDILDILHDTGLGTGTHSIISQGSLDSILQSKPEDRRSLIEEAAGVLKHKQRKQKSERKLEHMDAHLTRVQDVAAEVERQLKPLERKAKRAQAYQGLAAELAELNLSLAVDDLRILQNKWEKAREEETKLVEEIEQKRSIITSAEEGMQNLQVQIQERSTNADDTARSYRRAQSGLERLDATMLLLREKRRSAEAYEADLLLSIEDNIAKRSRAESNHAQSLDQWEKTRAEYAQAEKSLEELVTKQNELSEKRNEEQRTFDENAKKQEELTSELEAIRREQADNQEELSNSRAHEKLISSRKNELENQIVDAEKDFATASELHANYESQVVALKQNESEARERLALSFKKREEAQETLEKLRDETALLIAEIKGLEERERSREAQSPALSWVLNNKESFDERIEFVSQVMSVPEDIESLVEQVLGEDISALFVKDLETANLVASKLVEFNEEGEVVLLPRSGSISAQDHSSPVGMSLLSLVDYPQEHEDSLIALFGDVYVCASAEEAFSAYRKNPNKLRYATRDGLIVWPNGKVSFGNEKRSEEGVLARHRHLEELQAQRQRNKRMLDEASQAKEDADKTLQKEQGLSLNLSQELAQLQGSLKAAEDDKKRFSEKLETIRREFKNLERQQKEALEVLENAQPSSLRLKERLEELTAELEKLKLTNHDSDRVLEPLNEELTIISSSLAEARLTTGRLAERESYEKRMVATNEQEINALKQAKRTAEESLVRKRIALSRIEPLLSSFEALAKTITIWLVDLEEATSNAQHASSDLHEAVQNARIKTQEARDAFDKSNERLSEARIEKGRLEIQVETAISTIVTDCKTPLEKAIALPVLDDRETTESNAFKLRRRIANMGTINPDAAVEYEELKNRYDYMASQLDDLMNARAALAKIVRVIDRRMKDDFVITFKKVNENFKEIFGILFPGGTAELSLVDEEDPEHSGVEVTAQPRGKRITKMMLMSGGEKSLTAMALLFAVYRIRTTPFYILDEVEAALDDTNLRRICAYFNSLRHTTQLILITHQRRTMELADVLYGVSMQADGVTKIVSQKLEHGDDNKDLTDKATESKTATNNKGTIELLNDIQEQDNEAVSAKG